MVAELMEKYGYDVTVENLEVVMKWIKIDPNEYPEAAVRVGDGIYLIDLSKRHPPEGFDRAFLEECEEYGDILKGRFSHNTTTQIENEQEFLMRHLEQYIEACPEDIGAELRKRADAAIELGYRYFDDVFETIHEETKRR